MSAFVPGFCVYKYTLKHRIGTGCFGEVWLSHDSTIDRDVAVKIIKADGPLTVEKFKEARIGNRFDHDNLVKVHYADVVNIEDIDYIIIAMDYLRTGSILSQLNSCGFLPLPQALKVMRNILFGMDYLHRMGFFHNDIKPSNILVGTAGQAVLSDYGISRRFDETTEVPCYKLHEAPEILAGGNASICTDIYQCGLTAFRLFCGEGILKAKWNREGEVGYDESIKFGKLVCSGDFPEFVPIRVRQIILKAISLNPSDRYQSAIDMQRDFERLSYPGYWTTDENNQLVGRDNLGKEYIFYDIPLKDGLFDFSAKVKYPSGLTRRIDRFCKRKISKKEVLGIKKSFIKWVINT